MPAEKQCVGCRWIYRIKYKAYGSIEKYKARLVAKGFTQTGGLDYFETFAPVAKMTTVRSLLAIAAIKGWSLSQMDVTNAFLQGDLQEEMYMQLATSFEVPSQFAYTSSQLVCKLKRSLYGLKQAAKKWFSKFSSALLAYGFTHSYNDSSLFTFYQRLIGRFIYLTITRRDIAYVVLVLGQYIHHPLQAHRDATLKLVKYVKGLLVKFFYFLLLVLCN